MSAIIPVHCSHCGALFKSRKYSLTGSNLCLEGNTEPCIACGKQANLVDGVFDATEGLLKLVSGPAFTKDILTVFASLIEQAQKGTITEDELQKKAAALSPELGTAIKSLRSKGSRWPALLILLYALNQCKMEVKLDAKLDINDLLRQTIEWSATSKSTTKGDASDTKEEKKGGDINAPSSGAHGKGPDISHGWKPSVIDYRPTRPKPKGEM